MSKEEILKIQKCVLKVNMHCEGCKKKVKKILQKIDGVYTTEIDVEQGKVTVAGNIDPNVLIKKLAKSKKHAELWCAPTENNNLNNMANQMKNIQIDIGKGGGENNNNNGQKDPRNNQNQPNGGGQQEQNPQQQLQQQLQQLQQLQQMKGFEDLKGPQFKDMNMMMPPPNQNPNMKGVQFNLPKEDDAFTDDEFDDDDYSDEEFDYEIENPLNKMKLPMGSNGPAHMMMNAQKGAGNGGGNEIKGSGVSGGGPMPVQVHSLAGGNGNGGKKGGGGGDGNNQSQNQGGGNENNGGKNGGGMIEGKNGNKNVGGGGGGGNGGIPNNNMGKKVNGMGESGVQGVMNNGLPNMSRGLPNACHIDGNNMTGMLMGGGAMGNNMPMMGQMGGNMPAVSGIPEVAMNDNGGRGGSVGGGYGGPGMMMGGNPYQQHQYMGAMAIPAGGNDIFQPMMHARPPMAVNYMYPPPPYSYPPPPQHPHDPYSNYFNDENTSNCTVM